LNAAVLGVGEIVGGTMRQAFNAMALSARGARQQTRQIALAKSAMASAIQASMAFTKAVLFDTVDAAKVEFVASGEYATVWERTRAFGRRLEGTEEDKRLLDDLVRREICKYMTSNPAHTEAFGYCFKCEKNHGKWIATEQARKNGLTVREAVAGVLPLPELQEIAAKAAIEAVLNKRDPMAEAKKAAGARIETDALRVAKAVVALNFSGAKAEFIRPLEDSLAAMRGLLKSLKSLAPAEARHVSVFFESRLRDYERFGLAVKERQETQPKTPDIPAHPQTLFQNGPGPEARCQL
jgi:hypothetical protein